MEQLDFVDMQDNVLGSLPIREVYDRKLTHRIVNVFLFNDKRELLLQRRNNSLVYFPSFWSPSASGHVPAGHSYDVAAHGECREELGIDTMLIQKTKFLYVTPEGYKKFIAVYHGVHNGPFFPNSAEVDSVTFFNVYQLASMITNEKNIHPEFLHILLQTSLFMIQDRDHEKYSENLVDAVT